MLSFFGPSVFCLGLMEPVYICEIIVPQDATSGVYTTLTKRRGYVFGTDRVQV